MLKIVTFISLLFAVNATAQKLPNIQTAGLQAPVNVKIDGNTSEWGELQAYNKVNEVYYSLANDQQNLYLVVKASAAGIIEKIIHGGITLSVNTMAKKKRPGIPAITFPIYEKANYYFAWNIHDKPEASGNIAKDKMARDSFILEKTKQLSGRIKWIGTFNVNGITDSLTSIYNQDGIKASWAIDGDMCYNYELAVPLKRLGQLPAENRFYYNLQVNGFSFYMVDRRELRPGIIIMTGVDGRNFKDASDPQGINQNFPTDFWGEYTLTK